MKLNAAFAALGQFFASVFKPKRSTKHAIASMLDTNITVRGSSGNSNRHTSGAFGAQGINKSIVNGRR